MSGIYLGNGGLIRLRRAASRPFSSSVTAGAISTSRNRLVPTFTASVFTSGDKVVVTRVGGGALDFISGTTASSRAAYVNVDSLGGLRFYNSWSSALNNDASALTLTAPGTPYTVTIEAAADGFRTLGQVTTFTLNTARSTADTTSLGDSFTETVSTLISGSGTMECFWSYASDGSELETAMYFHQLAIRQQIGSEFNAAFVLKEPENSSSGAYVGTDTDGLYYLVTGRITNIAATFEPSEPVRSAIEFSTTGEITLHYGPVESFLLQENADLFTLEQGGGSLLTEAP